MTRTKRIPALIPLMAIAIAALAQTAAGQSRDERAIRAQGDAWQRYIATQNVDSLVGIFTPDAIVMFANAPPMKGSNAIRASWADIVKIPGLNIHWTPTRIDVASPTVATEYGTYTESYDTPSGTARDAGNYVTIWHKVNGKWRAAVDAPVSTMPAPTPMPAEATDFVVRNGSALSWSDFVSPGFAPGAKISVLHGNPAAPGRFVLRLAFPDGYQVPLHWHPTAENVTVVSGALDFGMGNAVDPNATQPYSQGDFVFIPARHAHWLQTRGPTVLQVSGNGPFQRILGAPK